MNVNKILVNLGFSQNESKVYLATLEMGQASAQDIAKKAKIKRTTTYSVLDVLLNKGFILKTTEQGKNRYIAESPQNIVKLFSEFQKDLEKSLPELEAIHNLKKIKPKVLFFEGKEGIKKIYNDTIAEKPNEILEYNTSDLFKTFPGFPTDYVQQRIDGNIQAKRIAPKDIKWSQHAKNDKQELSKTILLPRDEFDIPVEINIYNNKVAFMSYEDEIGLIIESEGIAKAMKTIYNLYWEKIK